MQKKVPERTGKGSRKVKLHGLFDFSVQPLKVAREGGIKTLQRIWCWIKDIPLQTLSTLITCISSTVLRAVNKKQESTKIKTDLSESRLYQKDNRIKLIYDEEISQQTTRQYRKPQSNVIPLKKRCTYYSCDDCKCLV